jgi:beta-RFAP synthase
MRVRAASRLHFGLLNLASAASWTNLSGEAAIPARRFGGVGLMIQEPALELTVLRGREWSANGPLAALALDYAKRFASSVQPKNIGPHSVAIHKAPRQHAGLGIGTQLGLSVAHALARSEAIDFDPTELTRRIGRGVRSALGIHGFRVGGLLVEGGKKSSADIAPLVARLDFPPDWRIVLAIPSEATGIHGTKETDAFATLGAQKHERAASETLCRLVLLGMLPALVERDLLAFSESLYDFNVRVGELFAPVQGGRYAHPMTAAIVSFLRSAGVRGVGQSSWGPTAFAILPDESQAEFWASRLRGKFDLETCEVTVTRGCNLGASIHSS